MNTKPDKTDIINVVTLGCSKNLVDSEFLMGQITGNNISVVHDSESFEAKTVIINTCGFIKDAKQESINTILQFIRAKEQGLVKQVYVTGCLSQRYKKDLEQEISNVDNYFGVNDMKEIIKHLGLNYKDSLAGERFLTTPSHYAYLKISEGCNRKCGFCAIPSIRGAYVSRPEAELVMEARNLSRKGVKELIIIAQDISSYGLDIYGERTLGRLLQKLSDIEGIEWIRLHYAYPSDFPEEVIKIMKEKENICKYLDIPLQHISDKILRSMRRGHSKKAILELIKELRQQVPGIILRTTLMTGYPGEGEKEYAELLTFIDEVRFERLGVFTYSGEEGTYAAEKLRDVVPERTKAARADAIMEKQMLISKELNDKCIGNLFKVIIDGREGEYYTGRTQGDSPEVDNEVLIPLTSGRLKTGDFYNIRITASEEFDLYGVPE